MTRSKALWIRIGLGVVDDVVLFVDILEVSRDLRRLGRPGSRRSPFMCSSRNYRGALCVGDSRRKTQHRGTAGSGNCCYTYCTSKSSKLDHKTIFKCNIIQKSNVTYKDL